MKSLQCLDELNRRGSVPENLSTRAGDKQDNPIYRVLCRHGDRLYGAIIF